MSRLRVLQYNVQKSKKVMEPLLADERVQSYDVIAIQEPWKNPQQNRTYCPRSSNFIPAYDDTERRTCFLLHKDLDVAKWEVTFHGPDLVSLHLVINDLSIWIHSVYSEPPGGYAVRQYNSPIPLLPELLQLEGEHILLGDFNLHHAAWSLKSSPSHAAAEPLLQIISSYDLHLVSPKGATSWEARGFSTTIDLTLASQGIVDRVAVCAVRQDLDFGSDHYPIASEFELESIRVEPQRRRKWKNMDFDTVAASAQHLSLPQDLSSSYDVDKYAEYLVHFTQNLVNQTVPWSKPSQYGQDWWTTEIKDAVREERDARRKQDWNRHARAKDKKERMILVAKRKSFRTMIQEATEGEGLWKLAKWGKTDYGAIQLPTMPTLRTAAGSARTIHEKAKALKERFYPEVHADLQDISDMSFNDDSFMPTIELKKHVQAEEVTNLLRTRRRNKAPGNDSISNEFLKAMGEPMAKAIAALTEACWKLEHYPERFRQARTVVIRKPGKPSYEDPGAWRPIALLNTIGKIIEALTAARIKDAAEKGGLLPDTQMGARTARSTDTAVELLTEQIHTVWKSPRHVASLLSLDLSGAFDTIHPIRLLDILRKKGYPGWLVRWVRSFISNRTTTLVIQGQETERFNIDFGVPQGSTLSIILFLLYASELLEICNQPKKGISAIGFADDTHILSYGTSTESNCRSLEIVHDQCMLWAKRHGMTFAPQKYELTHFSKARTKFNLQASARFQGIDKQPDTKVRVLGVWLDSKLRWTEHAAQVELKADRQAGALTRITASTWGSALVRGRQIYSSIVRSLLSYGAPAWHSPKGDKKKARKVLEKVQKTQNKCLRTVLGAFKATPIASLETEAFVPPIDLYLDERIAAFQRRLQASPSYDTIQKACKTIQRRLKIRGPRALKETPGVVRRQWCQLRDKGSEGRSEKEVTLQAWRQRWERRKKGNWDQIDQQPDKRVLKLHKNLKKAESSILVQLRTGRIGLAKFLHIAKVPSYDTGQCKCRQGDETPRHLLLFCKEEDDKRELLGPPQGRSLVRLLDKEEGVPRTVKWVLQGGRIKQFAVAASLLYE